MAAAELGRIGVRVNAIAPAARTRLTKDVPGFVGEMMKQPEDPDALDVFGPHQISPLVAYLAAEEGTETGKVYDVQGGKITELHGWTTGCRRRERHRLDGRLGLRAARRNGGLGRLSDQRFATQPATR